VKCNTVIGNLKITNPGDSPFQRFALPNHRYRISRRNGHIAKRIKGFPPFLGGVS